MRRLRVDSLHPLFFGTWWRTARTRARVRLRRLSPGSHLRHSVLVLSTVLQRWNACRIHAAAAEHCELRSAAIGAPWPAGVEALHEFHRLNPGPAVRGLLSFDPRLADIDVVGLRPIASLLE